MSQIEWAVLTSFTTEAEARVVESFLNAHGIQAQLLDTYSKYSLFSPMRGHGAGMRLMVRAHDLEAAQELLREQRPAHLEIVDGTPPPVTSWRHLIVGAILLGTFIFWLVRSLSAT